MLAALQHIESVGDAQRRTESRDLERRVTARKPIAEPIPDAQADAQQSHTLKMEEAVIGAGHAGERNIAIEWFWADLEGHRPDLLGQFTREGP